jgi:RNA polymerase sigma-70 factor (ECF subfamily)
MTYDDPQEVRAVGRLQEGDSGGYDYLVSKYLPRVVAIAWNIVRTSQDAEDLAQEAFVKAYQNIGRFRATEPFGPWIYRIVTNLSLDLQKHRNRFRREALDESQPAARRDDAELGAISGEIARRIDAALDELPEMQRVVARLHLIEQFEHSEIAAMLGLSEGTVRSHLSHGRKKLQERLLDLYGDAS